MAAQAEHHAAEQEPGEHHGSDNTAETVLVPNSQYQGPNSCQAEDAISINDIFQETQYDVERPTTADSHHSRDSDFDNTEDGEQLNALRADRHAFHEASNLASQEEPSQVGQLIRRPCLDDARGDPASFSYGKAKPPQLNLGRTPKQPVTLRAQACRVDVFTDNDSTEGSTIQREEAAPSPAQQDIESHSLFVDSQSVEIGDSSRQTKRRTRSNLESKPAEPKSGGSHEASLVLPDPLELRHVSTPPTAHQVDDVVEDFVKVDIHQGAQEQQRDPDYASPQPVYSMETQEDHHMVYEERYNTRPTATTEQHSPDLAVPTVEDAEIYSPSRTHNETTVPPRKMKRKRKTNDVPAPSVRADQPDQSQPKAMDFLQIAAHLIQKEKATLAKATLDYNDILAQLQQALTDKKALHDRLEAEKQTNAQHLETVEIQQAKLAKLKTKAQKIKTFVNGLGNDVDILKQEANEFRNEKEALVMTSKELRTEREAALLRLEASVERCRLAQELKETTKELENATYGLNLMGKELGDKGASLIEARDRIATLEKQLTAAFQRCEVPSPVADSYNKAILEKLCTIHATIEDAKTSRKDAELLEQTHAAVLALTSQQSGNPDDLALALSKLETLSNSVTVSAEEAKSAGTDHFNSIATLQSNLDNAFLSLTSHLHQNDDINKMEAVHRQALEALQEKLDESNTYAMDAKSQLSDLRVREADLQAQHTSLSEKLAAMQDKCTPADEELRGLRMQFRDQEKALEKVRERLQQKTDEVGELSAAKIGLQEELRQALRRQTEQASSHVTDFELERAELDRKSCLNLNEMRHEMAEHANQVAVEEWHKYENELVKRDAAQRKLERDLETQETEVESLKASLDELQNRRSSTGSTQAEEIESLKQRVNELEALLETAQSPVKDVTALEVRYHSQSTELEELKTAYQEAARQIDSLETKVLELKQSTHSEHKSLSELEQRRQEAEATAERLQGELAESQEKIGRQSLGMDLLKTDCSKEVKQATVKAEKQTQALQKRLNETEAQFYKHIEEAAEFKISVEKSWSEEEATHRNEVVELKLKADKVEAEKQKVMTENENLRKQLAKSVQRHALAVEYKAKGGAYRHSTGVEHQDPESDSNVSTPVLEPEQALAHDANAFHGSGPARTQDAHRGPIVEETQSQAVNLSTSKRSSDTDTNMMPWAQVFQKQHPTQTVPDSAVSGQPTSFADFNNRIRSPQVSNTADALSIFSVPSMRREESRTPQPLHSADSSAGYRSSQVMRGSSDSQDADAGLQVQDNMAWSQEEKEKYTYRKPTPSSNSASKLVRSGGGVANRHQGGLQAPQIQTHSQSGANENDRPSASGRAPTPLAGRSSSSHSDSPDFVHDAAKARKLSTYQASNDVAGTKRRASQVNTNLIVDPRLAGHQRPATPKRKLDGEAVVEYERERKKRSTTVSSSVPEEALRYPLRTQPSIHDLPALPLGPVRRPSASQPRLRNLAGGTPRKTRGSSKMSKETQFSARFSQELKR